MANLRANSNIHEKREEKEQNEKAEQYVRDLLKEKQELDAQKAPNAIKLIDEEIQKTQEHGKVARDTKFVDIFREKPIRVSVKVLVPVREHPKFNFVGKLLGPKGNTMKRLQEETMCKMAVLGRNSMKDKQKEEELRKGSDPKYAHLHDDLHVEIVAMAPPAEAHARIAFALAEVGKYLVPDPNDNIRQEQIREMEMVVEEPMEERRPPMPRGGLLRPPPGGPPRPLGVGGPPSMRPAARPPAPRGPAPRPVPTPKTKVFSILDRARVAIDQSYGYESNSPAPPSREYDYPGASSSGRFGAPAERYPAGAADDMYPPSSRFNSYEFEEEPVPRPSHEYYDAPEYPVQRSMKFGEDASRAWKSYKTTTTAPAAASRYRTAPYARPSK